MSSSDLRFFLVLGVCVLLGAAFLVVESRATKRLRAHRIARPARERPPGGMLTWQLRAYDPDRYDEEGKRILRRFRAQLGMLFATWVATVVICVLMTG